MTIIEFLDEIYLHDSILDNMNFDGINLILDIDLCWWKQKMFQSCDDKMKKVKVIFSNVSSFILDGKEEIDCDTIFTCSALDDSTNNIHTLIEIVFGDWNDIKIVSFRSDTVDLNWE